MAFIGCMVFISLAIGIYFAVQGAWLILPLQGLEMLFLWMVSIMLLRSQDRCEVIHLKQDELQVVQRAGKRKREWTFSRYWAQVILQPGAVAWYPGRLLIRSHGRELEIGSCLIESERKQLALELKQNLGRPQAGGPG